MGNPGFIVANKSNHTNANLTSQCNSLDNCPEQVTEILEFSRGFVYVTMLIHGTESLASVPMDNYRVDCPHIINKRLTVVTFNH